MLSLTPLQRAPTFLARTITTTPSRHWAAAAAVAPTPKPARPYVRKTPISTPVKPAIKPAVKPAAKASSPAAPTPATEAFDDFGYDDYPPPALADIEDYAHLAPPRSVSSTSASAGSTAIDVVASPPLTALPDGRYKSLPGPPAMQHILGEVPAPPSSDWSTSFNGLSERPFDKEIAEILLRPLAFSDIEMKPDGLIYLPEIKYRKTLNQAFGPGGWGLAPRGETNVGPRIVSREWGLVCLGRLVSIARGEQEYFDPNGVPTATEACKSNALMRCCKDLGIASELWDPVFIREFKRKHCVEVFAEHALTKKKKKLWRKKDAPKFDYPYKE